jgi:PIN domain nuclease of toxin-antitoxin system
LKTLLDTTYLLPFVGISIKNEQTDILFKLAAKDHEISVSEITIFELAAKAAKYTVKGEILPERVTRGIRALLYDNTVEKIPIYFTETLSAAFTLKGLMVDFIDCLILSTALNHCDVLMTEDQVILGLKKNEKYLELQSSINPKFKLQTSSDILKP